MKTMTSTKDGESLNTASLPDASNLVHPKARNPDINTMILKVKPEWLATVSRSTGPLNGSNETL